MAGLADRAGVDRIGVDLERRGKARRQVGRGTWISGHDAATLPGLAGRLRSAALFARCDPPHPGTPAQAERLLATGVQVLMLPMYRTVDEVRRFADAVAGRAEVVLLLETVEAIAALEATAAVSGVGEIHVGLNDLALACGLPSRFAALASPLLDEVATTVRAAGLRFGVGGIARPGDRTLPVPPELVYARLAALGATGTLLSRSFLRDDGDLATDVAAARACHADWMQRGPDEQAKALTALAGAAHHLKEF